MRLPVNADRTLFQSGPLPYTHTPGLPISGWFKEENPIKINKKMIGADDGT